MPETATGQQSIDQIRVLVRTPGVTNLRMVPHGLDGPAYPIRRVDARRTKATVVFSDLEGGADGATTRDYALTDVLNVAWEERTEDERRSTLLEKIESGLRWEAERVEEAWDLLMQKTREATELEDSYRAFNASRLENLLIRSQEAFVARAVLSYLDRHADLAREKRLAGMKDYAASASRLQYVPQSTSQVSNLERLYAAAAWADVYRRLEDV